MARRFGFGRRTGVHFPGEAKGILRAPEQWSRISLATFAIGQEVAVTPLQMVMAVAAVANGGLMPAPVLLDSLERDGRQACSAPPARVRRVISRRVADRVAALMRKVVREGTGRKAEVPGYVAAGKTGTAQKALPDRRGYSRTEFIMSFVGFAPYENPRFALIVVFDGGRAPGGAWGGTVAAPVWGRIARRALRYMGVPPEGAAVLRVATEHTEDWGGTSSESRTMGERVFETAKRVRRFLHGEQVRAPLGEVKC